MSQHATSVMWVVLLTIASGICDARGFIHGARVWADGHLVYAELARSALGFFLGISAYWWSIRYFNQIGAFSPEFQTVLWFGVTLVGVAVSSGRFLAWAALDQIVGVLVLCGIAWLFMRTGSTAS